MIKKLDYKIVSALPKASMMMIMIMIINDNDNDNDDDDNDDDESLKWRMNWNDYDIMIITIYNLKYSSRWLLKSTKAHHTDRWIKQEWYDMIMKIIKLHIIKRNKNNIS